MAACNKMPGTQRLCESHEFSPGVTARELEALKDSFFLHGKHMTTTARCYSRGNTRCRCVKMIVPQIQACVGKKDVKQLFQGRSRLPGGLTMACWLCAAADGWVPGPCHQQHCGTEHLGGHPFYAAAAGPARAPWSWPKVLLAIWDCYSSPGGQDQTFGVQHLG